MSGEVQRAPPGQDHLSVQASDLEKPQHHAHEHDDSAGATFEVNQDELPPGYFKSPFFIGTMLALGTGLLAGVAGFGYAAPVLTLINNDIGPDPNIIWVALSYTLTSACTLATIGRVTDIFGRRWVFVGGAVLGIIGSIISATATSVSMLIGGTTIIGIAAATQLSYYYVMAEIVPMQWRFAGNAFCYCFQIPSSGLAPAISNSLILHTRVGWRGMYYILIAINGFSFLCWFFFYHPPTFHMKHQNASAWKYIKNFDYVGTALFTGGLLVLMLGLNWGGTVHPWKSAYVIASIVCGAVALIIFTLWEIFMNLKEPLVQMELFENRAWLLSTILSGIGASLYYALAVVWPSMVAILYSDPTNPMYGPWLASLIGLFIVVGEILAGFLGKPLKHIKLQCIVTTTIAGVFFACTATCGPDSKVTAGVLVSLGAFFIGWTESLAITLLTMAATDQNNLGSASGLAGSIRFLISSIASTVYNVILNNRLATTIPEKVPPALTGAGLPATSVAKVITGLTTGKFEDNIPGLTPEILAVGTRAFQVANAAAYKTVFLSTIAFTGIAILCTVGLPRGLDGLLTGRVITTLHAGRDEKRMIGESRAEPAPKTVQEA